MHTDSGMTGISLSGFMPYMTVASLEMSPDTKNFFPHLLITFFPPLTRDFQGDIYAFFLL